MARGPLLVLAAAALSLSASPPSTFRQTVFVIVCALNANVTLNCLGLDRPAALARYLILPIRGKDLFLAKNVAVIVLLRSDSRVTALAIAGIVLLTMAAYYSSLRYAGTSFERRIETISRRLA